MSLETVFTNTLLVLPGEVLDGTIVLRGELIAEIQPGRARHAAAVDLGGDFLIPGIVDLHTDNLERQVQPRSNARWPSASALIAHDQQCAAAGVTTVLDAFCLGDLGFEKSRVRTFHEGVADIERLGAAGLLRSEHFLHLRCELPAEEMPELLAGAVAHKLVRLASLMDHTPGVGQYANIEVWRTMRRGGGTTEAELDAGVAVLQAKRARLRDGNRSFALRTLAQRGVAIASHDDRTEAEVAENAEIGIRISEFPVTLEAARAAKAAGMAVVAGAPNVVRGGSHTGNVSVRALVDAGLVDALASDYVPTSLLEAVFACGTALPGAVDMVTDAPARLAGLADRGALRPGLRADLVRVHVRDRMPLARATWRAGVRTA